MGDEAGDVDFLGVVLGLLIDFDHDVVVVESGFIVRKVERLDRVVMVMVMVIGLGGGVGGRGEGNRARGLR